MPKFGGKIYEEPNGAGHEVVRVLCECPNLLRIETKDPRPGWTHVRPTGREQEEFVELLGDGTIVGSVERHVATLYLDGSTLPVLVNHHELVVRRAELTCGWNQQVSASRLKVETQKILEVPRRKELKEICIDAVETIYRLASGAVVEELRSRDSREIGYAPHGLTPDEVSQHGSWNFVSGSHRDPRAASDVHDVSCTMRLIVLVTPGRIDASEIVHARCISAPAQIAVLHSFAQGIHRAAPSAAIRVICGCGQRLVGSPIDGSVVIDGPTDPHDSALSAQAPR